jgi:acetyltransferase-like isoleucine patch superfamily enzyme
MPLYKSHGDGKFERSDFAKIGKNVVIEAGVLVFNPKNIEIGDNVYIGHNTMLKAYHIGKLVIGDEVWIGQNCFIHGAGGVTIGNKIGIGPGVMMFSSPHDLAKDNLGPISEIPSKFQPIVIEDDSNIGMGAIIIGKVTIGKGTQVGAGSVVTRDTVPMSIVAGVPAKLLRMRQMGEDVEETGAKEEDV